MIPCINQLSNAVDNGGAGPNGKGLANGFSPNGQSRNQRGHNQKHHLRPGKGKMCQNLGRNGRGGGAGNDTADVAHHIVADGADPLRAAKKEIASLAPGTFRAAME